MYESGSKVCVRAYVYTGFGYVFLLSYKNLTTLFKTSDKPISTVATVSVSNPNRTELPQPVNITFTRLQVILELV